MEYELKRGEGCERVSIGTWTSHVKKGRVQDRYDFPREVVVKSWNDVCVRYVPVEAWRLTDEELLYGQTGRW